MGRYVEKMPSCACTDQSQLSVPHTHPVLAGKVTCVDCHDVHKGSSIRGGGAALADRTETCLRCHTAQAGPLIYPHGAIREEGCTACHNPHGTVNDKMLVAREARVDGKFKRSFELLSLDSLSVDAWADKPDAVRLLPPES